MNATGEMAAETGVRAICGFAVRSQTKTCTLAGGSAGGGVVWPGGFAPRCRWARWSSSSSPSTLGAAGAVGVWPGSV